jgi:hypothetical protein
MDRGEQQRVIQCHPLKIENLCNIFASVKTPQGLLEFTKEHGQLSKPRSPPWGESVAFGLRQAKIFRDLLRQPKKGSRSRASVFESSPDAYSQELGAVNLVPDRRLGIRLTITTESLITALWLQLGQMLSGGAKIQECLHCHMFFKTGGGSKRRDARFCCDAHRVRFNSLRRSQGV